jgi:PIF1-like helicase
MRLQAGGVNADFADWLASLSRDPDMNGPVSLPPYVHRVSTEDDLCERVFPLAELSNAHRDPYFFANRAILAMRNDQLPAINDKLMDRLPGEQRTYYADDEAFTEDGKVAEDVTREFLQTVQLPGLAPSVLQLKVGAPVILLRNVCPADGLCNGTRLVVTGMYERSISARILSGDHKGEEYFLSRIPLSSLQGQLPWIVTRYQIPVRPCFAMTVNKSQGQTLGVVGVDLRVSAFTHGQLNVCFSRTTDALSVTALLPEGIDTTLNVNYEDVMQDL